jgi:hypothetical protein
MSWAKVAHVCNPSNLRGWDQEDFGSSLAQVNSYWGPPSPPISKITRAKWTGSLAQAIELLSSKPPVPPKKKKNCVCVCKWVITHFFRLNGKSLISLAWHTMLLTPVLFNHCPKLAAQQKVQSLKFHHSTVHSGGSDTGVSVCVCTCVCTHIHTCL